MSARHDDLVLFSASVAELEDGAYIHTKNEMRELQYTTLTHQHALKHPILDIIREYIACYVHKRSARRS